MDGYAIQAINEKPTISITFLELADETILELVFRDDFLNLYPGINAIQ
jgi:hypothetical protein